MKNTSKETKEEVIPLITKDHPHFCVQLNNGEIECFHRDIIIAYYEARKLTEENELLSHLETEYLMALKLCSPTKRKEDSNGSL